MHERRRHHTLTLALLATAPLPSLAATADWLPTAPTTDFTDPANWSTGTAPTAADTARFDTYSAHSLTFTADVTHSRLLIAAADLTLDLAGHTYTLTDPNSGITSLQIGPFGDASLTVSNGTFKTAHAYLHLGAGNGTRTSLTIAGPNTTWTNSSLSMSPNPNNSVAVSGGATVVTSGMANFRGPSTISDPGTSWTANIIAFTQGSLVVQNGAAVSTKSLEALAPTGTTSTLTLRDPLSRITADNLTVGNLAGSSPNGTGIVNVNGGTLNANSVLLGTSGASALNLAGGTLTVARFAAGSDFSRLNWTAGSLILTNTGVAVHGSGETYPYISSTAYKPGSSLHLSPGSSLAITSTQSSDHNLEIDGGASVTMNGASLSVKMASHVGHAGEGSLSLDHGSTFQSGLVHVGSWRSVAGMPLSHGSGTVSLNNNSSWTAIGQVYIGTDGAGTLSIRNGSSLTCPEAFLNFGSSSSSAVVDGPGSSWTTTGTLTVAKSGRGSLLVTNGGRISTATANVGTNFATSGSATLDGAGTRWTNDGSLFVGRATFPQERPTGSVSLANHAALTTRFLLLATGGQHAVGSLHLSSAATLTVSTSAYLGGNATTPGGTATLSLTDAAASVATLLKLHPTPNTSLSLTRSTLAVGTPTTPGTLDNAATLTLADHSILTLHGTLSLPAGTLTLDPTSTLHWTPDSATTPNPAATLRALLSAARIAPSAPQQAIAYSPTPADPTTYLLQSTLPGDINLDGFLSADDYTLLDRSFALNLTNATWTDGDLTYDGAVTSADYLLIDRTYLLTNPAASSPALLAQRNAQFGPAYVASLLTSIPEPASLTLLIATLPLRRRRRVSH